MQPVFKVMMPWHETGEAPDDQIVFEKLMATASDMYAQTDRISRALRAKTPSTGGSFRKFDVKQGTPAAGSSNRMYIELIDVEKLPFSVAQMSSFVQSLSNRVKTSRVRKGSTVRAIKAP